MAILDRSLALLRHGYPYLLTLREPGAADAVDIRLLGRRTTVVSGPAGVRLFYNEAVMRRHGAMPLPLQYTLFGRGAIHGLDGAEHKHRKAMFLDLLTDDAALELGKLAGELWGSRDGSALDPVGIFDAAVAIHSAVACRWAGIPARFVDRTLGRDLARIVDGFGSPGRRGWRAVRARRRVGRWSRRIIARIRGGHLDVEAGSPVDVIARYPDLKGNLLPARVAAVELINVLRPIVAVAYLVAFAAHALATTPELRADLAGASDDVYDAFADEVRRKYPFVPVLAARVERDAVFEHRRLPRGRRVLLDVYGTLHDPTWWPDPEAFRLDRFTHERPDADTFVPQGGGNPATGHRCPGERQAIELVKCAARRIVDAPPPTTSAWHIPLRRMPTRPYPEPDGADVA